METLPVESNSSTQRKGMLAGVLTYLALLVIVTVALTFIGFAEAILPGSYSIIVSLSVLTGFFLIVRTLMKNFDPQTTEALAASIAPNAAAAAAAASAPRNAEDVAKEPTKVASQASAVDAGEAGTDPEQR